MHKSITVKIENRDYIVAYKTKLGFVKELTIFEIIENSQKVGIGCKVCKEIDCKIKAASTFTDWLRYLLKDFRHKFCNKCG